MAELREYTVTPHEGITWEALRGCFAGGADWTDTTPLYVYLESVQTCELKQVTLAEANPPQDAWEGRLFDKECEVRWVRERNGWFRAWVTREITGKPGGIPAIASCRRYYLMGLFENYHAGQNTALFTEGRYTNKQFLYPVPPGGNPQPRKDRAYIEVMEYTPVKPPWPKEGATTDGDFNQIEELLDQPMLLAHRFFRVDVGRD